MSVGYELLLQRLGLGNRIAQLTIVTWKAYTIITAQQFLVSTKPTGQVTAFFESDATFLETQQSFGEMIRNGESNQCADPMQVSCCAHPESRAKHWHTKICVFIHDFLIKASPQIPVVRSFHVLFSLLLGSVMSFYICV